MATILNHPVMNSNYNYCDIALYYLHSPLFKDIPDILFIFPSKKANFHFDLWSSEFVGMYLDSKRPILLESAAIINRKSAEIQFQNNKPLFDRAKVLNLKQRQLAIATHPWTPYSVLTEVPEETGDINSMELYLNSGMATNFPKRTLHWDGIEATLMKEFCRKFNCSLFMTKGKFFL